MMTPVLESRARSPRQEWPSWGPKPGMGGRSRWPAEAVSVVPAEWFRIHRVPGLGPHEPIWAPKQAEFSPPWAGPQPSGLGLPAGLEWVTRGRLELWGTQHAWYLDSLDARDTVCHFPRLPPNEAAGMFLDLESAASRYFFQLCKPTDRSPDLLSYPILCGATSPACLLSSQDGASLIRAVL